MSWQLPDLPSRWKSTWYHSPSLTFLLTALVFVVPEPMSSSRNRWPSSISMAKKSTLRDWGLLESFGCCLGLPWLKRRRPLGSVVRKSKEMEPVFFAFHLLRMIKDSGVSNVMGSRVATFSHLKATVPWTFILGSPSLASLDSSSLTSLFLYTTWERTGESQANITTKNEWLSFLTICRMYSTCYSQSYDSHVWQLSKFNESNSSCPCDSSPPWDSVS